MSVDTLSLARELRSADLAAPQADAIAAAIGRAVVETAASKADLGQLEERLGARIDRSMGELRTEIAKAETRYEAGLTRLIFWLGGIVVAVGGLGVAMIKLLPNQG